MRIQIYKIKDMLQTWKVIHLNKGASEKKYQEKLKSHSMILQNNLSTKAISTFVHLHFEVSWMEENN